MVFKSASISKIGGREENQDYCGSKISDHSGLWIVADGLGGHRGGAIASQSAVQAMLDSWNSEADSIPQIIDTLIIEAHATVLKQQSKDPQFSSMRTTLVALHITNDHAIWGHVGDSRLYYFSGGDLILQTEDHSVTQAMFNIGEITQEEMRYHEDRSRLLRAVGNPDGVNPTILASAQPISPGDAFLMCTDGFWEYVKETEMVVDMAKSITPMEWLERMELRLTSRVQNDNDNYTALAVFITGESRDIVFKTV